MTTPSPRRIFVDLDDTLCSKPSSSAPYTESRPIQVRVDYVNSLYDAGHTIVIWTARGGATGVDYSELTRQQLSDWGVKHHQLVMGKPSYDVYLDDKSFQIDTLLPVPSETGRTKKRIGKKVEKTWGHEIIFANRPEYCGKLLVFKKNARFSMHYHVKKVETWYVSAGRFLFAWPDPATGEMHCEELAVGDVITNERGEAHQVISLEEGATLFEVSTEHEDSDSYRMWRFCPGDCCVDASIISALSVLK